MVEKKSGPVKPPIIDAKPRPSDKPAPEKAAEPSTQAAAASTPTPAQAVKKDAPKPETPKTEPDKVQATETGSPKSESPKPSGTGPATPPAAPQTSIGPLLAAAAGGGLIGLALAYAIASFGLWPQSAADPGLSALESRTAQLEAGLSERDGETSEFETRIEDLELQLATFDEPEPVSTEMLAAQADLDTLASRITELSARIEAVAAGATGDEVTDVAQNLTGLSSQVSALTERLDAIEPQIAETAPALEAAMIRLDALDARIADQSDFEAVTSQRDRVAQLPAAITALEAGIAAGQPFSTQLAQVETLLPTLSIAQESRDAAASGVTSPAELLGQLRAAIPAMLAAMPRDPQANWAQTLLDQAASTLALRPTEGDSPQGLVGRTEAALATGDLAAAEAAFAALPEPMRAAAPGFAQDLAQTQNAQALLEMVRAADPMAEAEAAQ